MDNYKFNYTIIIPHKNIPNLLQRCLDSIPERDDLQIIVIDDNSDTSKVDFNHFPGIERKNVEIYFTKEGKGAGYARNVGLKHAQGKWILFADADDFFNYCFEEILDKYEKADYDVVFFNANSVNTETYTTTFRCKYLNKMVQLYEKEPDKSIFYLKYCFGEPWAKMIKLNLIKENGILFSETTIHNDTKFSYLVGYYSSHIYVDEHAIYCITDRTGSISKCISIENLLIRTYIFSEATVFFQKHNIHLFGAFTFTPLKYFIHKRDWENCRKCIQIMKSCGMSNQLMIKGFLLDIIKRPVKILLLRS